MQLKAKSMYLFYFSITLAICSSALYHFVAKGTPPANKPKNFYISKEIGDWATHKRSAKPKQVGWKISRISCRIP